MKIKIKRLGSFLLSLVLCLSLVPVTAAAETTEGLQYAYGDTTAVKITNPLNGSGEDDGLVNGTDRLNSYAWAMAKRGDYIYIGTNRAFISSEAYGAISRMAPMFQVDNVDELYKIFNYFTYGELPDYTELTDEDCIPEIIKLDPRSGETEIIDLPPEFMAIATKAEGCAFRSVVEQNGNLYFGSYGRNYVFLIRVDENDRATVAFMAGGESTGATIQYNSLRACGVYEGKQYFGGSSSSLEIWNADENKNQYVPLFIAEMKDENYDPNGASTQEVTFNNYIADYRDFSEYADPKDPSVGNEFYDLVTFEGSIYAIISDSYGFAVYKGHPAADGETANPYGWNWTLVVDGANDETSPAHGFIAATPYIFQDELYIGSFSSIGGVAATGAQMFMWVQGTVEKGDPGRKLSDVMRPLYDLMKKDAKVFRLENDQLKVVEDAAEKLEGKCAVYLWRFQELRNELYMTTFDASILFKYILDISLRDILNAYLTSINEAVETMDSPQGRATARAIVPEADSRDEAVLESAKELAGQLEAFGFSDDNSNENEEISLTVDQVEALGESMMALREAVDERLEDEEVLEEPVSEAEAGLMTADLDDVDWEPDIIEKLKKIIDSIDEDGLRMVVEMKQQLDANTSGFDLLKTPDGKEWSFVLDDGYHDKYNFGGRTMVVYDGQLHVGTANPFYGAQVWRMENENEVAQYMITFDPNGGSVSPASAVTGADGRLQELPTPTRSGSYSFDGWYTAPDGGENVTVSTVFTEDSTIYAHWTVIDEGPSAGFHSSASASYVITVVDAENGSVTVSHKTASEGTTITVTVSPDQGYKLNTLKVTDQNGDQVKLTEKDGKYTFVMPASSVTVSATFTKITENLFTDVNGGAYYKDAVIWAVENGITNGTSGATFSPDDTCTRAQAVTFLWRAAGNPAPKSSAMPFRDVAAGAYYYDAVLWAVENGITVGTAAATFGPDDTCTRAQIVAFLWRAQNSPAASGVNPFTDVAADAYYADAVAWAVENGITTGTTATTFSSDDTCTRAQIVTFLYRCLGE